MKKNLKFTFLFFILMAVSCTSSQEDESVDLSAICMEPYVLLELTEPIPAKVKVVQEGQPFFNGVKTYYEVDAETHLPDLFELNEQTLIRIFPVRSIDLIKSGENTSITGRLISCVTGDHGLLTNDYKVFTIIE